MKHGKGAKKASSAKKTPRKGSSKAPKKLSKESRTSAKGSAGRSPAGQAAARASARGDGKANRSATVNFSNPAVASAFRRALKKYSSALRRLTD